MDWREIPSLTSLRALEAVARCRSLSAAARELNVTHAAIAQHIRTLETHFNQPLARRQGRGMVLTPAGDRLCQFLSDGFLTIQQGVRLLTNDRHAARVRVSLTPSFAANWLMPRLGGFLRAHPNIEPIFLPNPSVVDLQAEDIDVAIRYGSGMWPGARITPFLATDFLVVGARSLVGDCPTSSVEALARLPWLIEDNWSEPVRWMQEMGLDISRLDAIHLPAEMVLPAARAGQGITVAPRHLIEDALASGILEVLVNLPPVETGYFLLTPGRPSPSASAFMDWLLVQAAKDANGPFHPPAADPG